MLNKINLIFALVFLFSINSFAQAIFTAKVVGVVDGDTLTVLTKEKRQLMFHLAGIDAPEKDQNFGAEARGFLSNLVLNQTVTVSGYKNDCLDRPAASASFNNKDLSLAVIESGSAWADPTCQTDETLVKKELSARESKRGLWQNPNPVRPGDFINSKQQTPQAAALTTERRIFTGLAPIPPPPRNGLYIGMTLESFQQKCGKDGKMSKIYTTEGYQAFDLDVAETSDNSGKGCAGSFSFKRTSDNALFTLSSAFQIL